MEVVKTIKLNATLRDIVGQKKIEVPFRHGQTVRELLGDVHELEPALYDAIIDENGELTGMVHILVHGRNITWLQGMETIIEDHHQIVFMPPSAGG